MLVKINGETWFENPGYNDCVWNENYKMDCSNVPIPSEGISQDEFSNQLHYFMAKWDQFNYEMMSKTEVTEFIYRYSNDMVNSHYKVWEHMITSVTSFF